MSEMPWVRFFPSDWLGGTRGMSAVETGVYITLVASMYERGEPIPEDSARLSRLCGASNSAFKAALESLVEEGKILRIEGGLWNDRVGKEQVYRLEKSEVGKSAASKRWEKSKQKQYEADADALQSQCVGNANQKPDTITIKEKEEPLRGREASEDVRKVLFVEGVRTLQARAGLPDRRARPILAKWLQTTGDDAGRVLAKIRQAEADDVLDLVAWVTKAIQPKPKDWRLEPEYRGVL